MRGHGHKGVLNCVVQNVARDDVFVVDIFWFRQPVPISDTNGQIIDGNWIGHPDFNLGLNFVLEVVDTNVA